LKIVAAVYDRRAARIERRYSKMHHQPLGRGKAKQGGKW